MQDDYADHESTKVRMTQIIFFVYTKAYKNINNLRQPRDKIPRLTNCTGI